MPRNVAAMRLSKTLTDARAKIATKACDKHGIMMHAIGVAGGLLHCDAIDPLAYLKITTWIQGW